MGQTGYKTREPDYITDFHIPKEAFAHFLEIYLSGDEERIEVLQKYFKYSYNRFLKLLQSIKEQL